MSWVLLVRKNELDAAGGHGTGTMQIDLRPLRILNPDTGEIREWPAGLSGLVEARDEYMFLCGRIARALGPVIVKRWEDGDESLDLATEVERR